MARILWPSSAACVQVGNLAKCPLRITVMLLNCSLCFLAGTQGQGQKDLAQSGMFPLPPEPVLQEVVFRSRGARDAKYFCSNILSLKCCSRHLLSYSLAYPD